VRKRSQKHQKKYSQAKDSQSKSRGKPSSRNAKKTLVGRVQKNPRGFAFLIPEDRTQRDVYVGREDARYLMNDDVVRYTIERGGRRPSAIVESVVKRGQKELVGRVRHFGRHLALDTGDGENYPLLASDKPADGEWVIGEVEEYPSPRSDGQIRLVERLGGKLVPRMDVPIALAKFGLSSQFPLKAIQDAHAGEKRGAEAIAQIKQTKRRDMRSMPFVTIDGEDAKDFDDAIYVERASGEKAFTLYVSIADVSFFVLPGTGLDQAARARGTSVYFPGTCVPMLPEELSNELCSLKPRQERLSLTAEIQFDRDGTIRGAKFYESLIKTAARLTYNQVHDFIEGKKEEFKDLEEPLNAAYALYRKMALKRKERGVLDFELPETRIEVDDVGRPTRLYRAERFESHKLIEEFMIAANQVVAEALRKAGRGSLYRVHESPDPSTLDEINMLMRSLGISKIVKDLSPRSLSALLSSTLSMKGARTLHQAILRLQKQARYEPEPKGHYGLALSDYTHFTSPIRRYPDLVVHRALKKLIGADKSSDKRFDGEEYLIQTGIETSELERRAMQAERFVVRRKQCWFMQDRLGETFEGEIGSVIENGLFIDIPSHSVEGFVPIDSFRDRYVFDEQKQCFRRRPGHTTLSIGDPIRVQLSQVDIEQGQITLVPVENDSQNKREPSAKDE
jgi:ribonuclease R